MGNEKIVLKGGQEITIEQGSSLPDIRVVSASMQDMVTVWAMLSEKENLKNVEVKNADGNVIGSYNNLILDNETSTVLEDGTISTSFNLREKTEVEILKEEIARLKEDQEVQGDALAELGSVVSDLSGGV